jgi:SNF2 family DNA or RNA helicase
MTARCDLSADGKRIEVFFPYGEEAVRSIKRIPGARYKPKPSPRWTVPLDLDCAQLLREQFGLGLELGDDIVRWGREEVARRRNLGNLVAANDATLTRLPTAAPLLLAALNGEPVGEQLGLPARHGLSRARDRRGYQFADIAMMAQASVLNANQPGTGKTIEVVGALAESGLLEAGAHLVVAPVKSLVNVWKAEFERWTNVEVFTAEAPAARKNAVEEGLTFIEREGVSPVTLGHSGVVVIVNPDFIRADKIKDPDDGRRVIYRDFRGDAYAAKDELRQRLYDVPWKSVTIDEFHKMGLNNQGTLLHIGLTACSKGAERRYALSGTPMGGKTKNLWPVLNWIEPEQYPAKWRWYGLWLEIEDNGFGKTVGEIKPGLERKFYEAHSLHMVRRLKKDALPGLPEKVEIIVECGMSKKQRAQYESLAREAEVLVEGGRISASMVLAEYTRLKQIANATCKIDENGDVQPTADSDKIEQLMEKLDEEGLRKLQPEPGARAIVASESKRFIKLVADTIRAAGVACEELTGDTKDSAPLIERFQSDSPEPYVIAMTTQTGGVSLNLEAAGSVHALDETWNPDDMEQLFDRADRGSRDTPLRCYTYRTSGTVQQYIAEVGLEKSLTNAKVLDVVRQALQRGKS